MQENKKKDELKDALIKRAVGYTAEEVVSEYSDDNGVMKMVRKKVSKKCVPPDVSAVKLLVELSGEEDVKNLSDEELENEKLRLLKLLEKAQKEDL